MGGRGREEDEGVGREPHFLGPVGGGPAEGRGREERTGEGEGLKGAGALS